MFASLSFLKQLLINFFCFLSILLAAPVNGWGFQRKFNNYSLEENNSYVHPLFVRDSPENSLKMIRSGARRNAAGERIKASALKKGWDEDSIDSELEERKSVNRTWQEDVSSLRTVGRKSSDENDQSSVDDDSKNTHHEAN